MATKPERQTSGLFDAKTPADLLGAIEWIVPQLTRSPDSSRLALIASMLIHGWPEWWTKRDLAHGVDESTLRAKEREANVLRQDAALSPFIALGTCAKHGVLYVPANAPETAAESRLLGWGSDGQPVRERRPDGTPSALLARDASGELVPVATLAEAALQRIREISRTR